MKRLLLKPHFLATLNKLFSLGLAPFDFSIPADDSVPPHQQGVNFTNILEAAFLYKSTFWSFSRLTVWLLYFLSKARKILVKLTKGQPSSFETHLTISEDFYRLKSLTGKVASYYDIANFDAQSTKPRNVGSYEERSRKSNSLPKNFDLLHYYETIERAELNSQQHYYKSDYAKQYVEQRESPSAYHLQTGYFLGSISPKFYNQLLLQQIPKVQKDTSDLTVFLSFWDLHA